MCHMHAQSYGSASENFLEVMQAITSCNFSFFRKQNKFGTLKLRGKVEEGTDKSFNFPTHSNGAKVSTRKVLQGT